MACSPGGVCGAPPPQLPQCCWLYIKSSQYMYAYGLMGCIYCMMCWEGVGGPHIAMFPKPGPLEHQLLKAGQRHVEVCYREERCFVKDQSRDGLLSSWGCGAHSPQHPRLMSMALYSVLTMYYMHMSLYEVYMQWCVNVLISWCVCWGRIGGLHIVMSLRQGWILDGLLPGQGAVGSVAAAPVVGPPMLLALYSVLTYILYAYGLVWGVCIASCVW